MAKCLSEMSDENFFKLVLNNDISLKYWTHSYHIRLAYILATKYDSSYEVFNNFKFFVQKTSQKLYKNESHRGYHETLTVFWLSLVLPVANEFKKTETDSIHFYNENKVFWNKYLPYLFYSKELLFSNKAKNQFIQPNKNPFTLLPEIINTEALEKAG